MVIIISLAAVAVILALCLVFYLVNGARFPNAGADPAVIRKATRDHEQRVAGIH
jgi:hypothetical protein